MSSLTDDILSNVDIVDIVSRYVSLKRVGKNYAGLCPFHREKSPSFTVAPDKQIYKCFGCGAGGNAIKFVMDYERVDFWDAIKMLAKDARIDVSKYKISDEKIEKSVNEKEKLKLINKHVQNFFMESFNRSELAKDYIINKRKLSDNIIRQFGIGYAPDSHYELINHIKSKGFSDNDILQAGLGSKGSTGDIYSFFRNRIMFPIFDHMGNVAGFAGRSLKSEDMPKYLNTTETMLYDKSQILYGLNIAKDNIKNFDKLIVVEGYMDVIGLARGGFPIGVATCGTAMTVKHIKVAKRYTENIVLAFDNDQAGVSATIRALKIAYEAEVFPKVLIIPSGFKDIDEYINSVLGQRVEFQEIDGFDYVFDKLYGSYDMGSPIDRKKLTNQCFDIIISINDHSIRDFYMQGVAKKLGISYGSLMQSFDNYRQNNKSLLVHKVQQEPLKKMIFEPDERYMLGALFYDDFIEKNKLFDDNIRYNYEFISDMSRGFEDSLIYKISHHDMDMEDKEKLLESQLWREKQFENIQNNKKQLLINNFLNKQIHKFSKIVIKSSKISQDMKNDILNKIKKLTKN